MRVATGISAVCANSHTLHTCLAAVMMPPNFPNVEAMALTTGWFSTCDLLVVLASSSHRAL